MKITFLKCFMFFLVLILNLESSKATSPIDRYALVTRHNITITQPISSVLQVGNGEFSFGVDITGLQTTNGNTMSQWGWHSFPLPANQKPEDLALTEFDVNNRKVKYATAPNGNDELFRWLRENPHRNNLGRFRLLLDGSLVDIQKMSEVKQHLDLWKGYITTSYILDNQLVNVLTCCHPQRDIIAFSIKSPLISSGRLSVELAFPYGDPGNSGANWKNEQAHTTTLKMNGKNNAHLFRQLDMNSYVVNVGWHGVNQFKTIKPHTYIFEPKHGNDKLEIRCAFMEKQENKILPDFNTIKNVSTKHWANFWNTGGAIDLSTSKDSRWFELERRIVLSQYLLAVNEAGSLPPQESGLYNNSGWNGKFHLEMHWWHGTHYALWGRWPLFERSLDWYFRTLPQAQKIATSQGYTGARWPKMVGPDGLDSPSGTGPLLAWQQPNPIYYALLDYRLHPSEKVLEKWKNIVFESAEFMASYVVYNDSSKLYNFEPPLKTVPENTNALVTRNPTFEINYWRFGLQTALEWQSKLGIKLDEKWKKVLNNLPPLPMVNGVYLQQEGMLDTYTKMNWEHPSLIGPLGMIPGYGVDSLAMKRTVRKVMAEWQWNKCWGWDFPMMAMGAARNGEPAIAVDVLLYPSKRNSYNQFGLTDGGPFPYFPTNGGLLFAVAMMAAGWDGAPSINAPGFPSDGSWVVKWEGLKKAP